MPPRGISDHVWRHYCVTPGGKGAVAPSRWRGTDPGCSPHHRVYPAPNVNRAEVEKPDVVKKRFLEWTMEDIDADENTGTR